MLTWPKSAVNPIPEELNFNNFLGEDAPRLQTLYWEGGVDLIFSNPFL